jgi:Ion channel
MAKDISARQPQGFGLLFVSLFATFWVMGVGPDEEWNRALVTAMLGGTLLLAFWVAEMRAWVVAACVAAVAGSGDAIDLATAVASAVLVVLAPPAVVIGLARAFRKRRVVTRGEVLGALSLYLLAGMLFAFVYSAASHAGSGAFFADGVEATASRCLYYSFTTLTTVGYGDLTARTDFGHTLSATEALVGQIYLVTVVAVIVSNLRPGRGETVA